MRWRRFGRKKTIKNNWHETRDVYFVAFMSVNQADFAMCIHFEFVFVLKRFKSNGSPNNRLNISVKVLLLSWKFHLSLTQRNKCIGKSVCDFKSSAISKTSSFCISNGSILLNNHDLCKLYVGRFFDVSIFLWIFYYFSTYSSRFRKPTTSTNKKKSFGHTCIQIN